MNTALIWSVISLGLFMAYRWFRIRHQKSVDGHAHYLYLALVLSIMAVVVISVLGRCGRWWGYIGERGCWQG